ncbi:efflux RND transporter periplasmic adaptor subunit [Idiomarina seosinensis]|uniref:efflux RND transporter periplasmic adaptor subunit n=1 Tax=Idiomarina seosinensis TaxID=281739 RepID=UPI00384F9765
MGTWAVFIAIVILVVLWIGSGVVFDQESVGKEDEQESLPTVAVFQSEARPVTRQITLNGDIEPYQRAIVRARTDGMLEYIAETGRQVNKGDKLAELSMDDRQVQLEKARAQVKKAESDYQAAQRLNEQNLSSESELQALKAKLEAARAELRRIDFDIENTELSSPVTGVVNRQFIEQGAYVAPGSQVLEVVDNDPLLAVVYVQQNQIHRLQSDMPASVRTVGGEKRQGEISFIAPVADPQTRAFRVEVTVPNQQKPLPAGMSAEVTIDTNTVDAHKISAAQIKIDAAGQIGVLTVDEQNIIRFKPVVVERADVNALWVSGLDSTERLVVISHGSLADGQKVKPKPAPDDYPEKAAEGGE